MAMKTAARRLPVGADVLPEGGVSFRVWAPKRRKVAAIVEASPEPLVVPLAAEGNGYFSAVHREVRAGQRYRYRLDDDRPLYPDPISRFQPEGPHGPSQIVDPGTFSWTDQAWRGCGLEGQIVYEMHIGTFTKEGTWEAARRELPELASLGVTILEIMPVADFPGRFGWGYDGVNLFAPTRLYGDPDDFRRFIDSAHAAGLGVILDAVYNHIGPDGNYLKPFAEAYFTDRYKNEWGEALNFDGPDSGPVRELFIANAGYWIDELHLDGLRLDATQQIFDSSSEHILTALTRRVREAARGRATFVVAENEPQEVKLVRSEAEGGYGIDALWNDDFHHSATVVLTGHNEAYYTDYLGNPQEFISAVKWGYLYQGQRYRWQKKRRGTPALDLKPAAFVTFIQNHDQVANSANGLRCHLLGSRGRYRAMTGLLLLAPGTPMLFQGQEFAASNPFLFFADHNPELAKLVSKGRGEFLAQFPSIALPEIQDQLPDPADPATFERCRLDFGERASHADIYALHRDLIRLRRSDPVFAAQKPHGVDGAVLGAEAFVLRFFGGTYGDRLVFVNFGRDLHLDPAPEPLLAPPQGSVWDAVWSSENVRYGGNGGVALESEENWRIPGEATVVMAPRAAVAGPSA
jgi:maltooligosyltrehalose trehalohydrolase